MPKPATQPTWATSGSALITAPGAGKQDTGWVVEIPPVEFMNWWMNNVGLWVEYIDTELDILIAAPAATDELVKVSANDTTAKYLFPSLVAGPNVTITELNDGGNETVQIEASVPVVPTDPITKEDLEGENVKSFPAELSSLSYNAGLANNSYLNDSNAGSLVDYGASKTDSATYDEPATLTDNRTPIWVLSYDAAKTVTGTSTSMTMSAAPSFTVKAGDILMVGSEARIIASLTDQQNYTLNAAFTSDPTATVCTVSQGVHSVDMNAFTAGGTRNAIGTSIVDPITEALIRYGDSDTADKRFTDLGVVPNVAYVLSGDGTNWTDVQVRQTNITDQELAVDMTAVQGTQMKAIFFSNKTSGSGTVNLINFSAFFHVIV